MRLNAVCFNVGRINHANVKIVVRAAVGEEPGDAVEDVRGDADALADAPLIEPLGLLSMTVAGRDSAPAAPS